MHYCKLNKCDIANGPGVRVSLFVSGCRNACKGCFNTQAWDFNYGEKFTDTIGNEIINALKSDYISGLSILGGEPMEPENQMELLHFLIRLCRKIKHKSIWVYTGYTFEQLIGKNRIDEVTVPLLGLIDVLVDGRFEESLKDVSLKFRGSSNQRIIDVRKSLASNEVILFDI